MQFHGLPSVWGRLAEGYAIREGFKIGAVEMHFELIACFVMETRLYMDSGDVRIYVHHEHGAVAARENVQVVDKKLAVLGREGSVEMMGHGSASFSLKGKSWVSQREQS